MTAPLLDRGSATATRRRDPGGGPGRDRPDRLGRRVVLKFLAKLAFDHRKPDELFVITPKMEPAFVEDLPVGKFHGVGPRDRGQDEAPRHPHRP